MLSEPLHIIAFDVPHPPDYGGVIDVFYKIRSLHALGVKIHLHCFAYGRPPSAELESLCESVHYYPRQNSKSFLFNTLPFIVLSRQSEELKERLLNDNYPVLMEGLHSTFLLQNPEMRHRKIVVRTHNVEHEYYENLGRVERNIFKRYYFLNEAMKLKKHESVLSYAQGIAAISKNDKRHFMENFPHVMYVPAFHPHESVQVNPGKGDFAFYHGNLSVGENNEAALWLVNKVFSGFGVRLVIAGSKPSQELQKAVRGKSNIELLPAKKPEEIYRLIAEAQCNVLPTFQSTGIKLKLLAALFCGRRCLVNTPMVKDTGLESLCLIADTAEDMRNSILEIMSTGEMNSDEIANRKRILEDGFSNLNNAKKVLSLFN